MAEVDTATVTQAASTGTSHSGWLVKLETWLDGASERFNPILVKESRQALKSRQFAITFTLLLILALVWSFFAVAAMTPAIYYAPAGKFMLSGYYWILLFPLVVIVPFSAFRSLAAEREDGTYELLTITTLKAHQVVAGKLGSSILQMVVYLSALAPCIAFTYLLRGVDIALILLAIVGTFMLSVLLSGIALLLATLSNARHLQVILSVILILGLAGVFFFVGVFFTSGILFENFISLADPDTLYVIGGLATAWVCVLALAFLAATARIQFLSDNRSTSLRVAMFVSGLCIIGWFLWYGIQWGVEEGVAVMVGFSMFFWWLMGAFMVGERPELSPRVRRDLPATFLGRVCLTWFQPGPGPGYFFAVANVAVCSLVAVGISLYYSGTARWGVEWVIGMAVIAVCYVAAYVGAGRLIVRSLRRTVEGPLLSFLIHVVLLATGVLLPLIVQYSIQGTSYGYTSLQVSNPFWTLDDGFDRGAPTFSNGWYVTLVVMIEAALLMMVVNFVLLARDLMPVRSEVPERILEESPVVEKASRTSPWDDG